MDKEGIETLKKLLIGGTCKKFHFEAYYPVMTIGKRSLSIYSVWRISESDQILLSDSGFSTLNDFNKIDKKKYEALFTGKKIVNVTVSGRYHDLCLEFENDLTIETFSTSNIYDSWELDGGPQETIVGGPGTSWSEF